MFSVWPPTSTSSAFAMVVGPPAPDAVVEDSVVVVDVVVDDSVMAVDDVEVAEVVVDVVASVSAGVDRGPASGSEAQATTAVARTTSGPANLRLLILLVAEPCVAGIMVCSPSGANRVVCVSGCDPPADRSVSADELRPLGEDGEGHPIWMELRISSMSARSWAEVSGYHMATITRRVPSTSRIRSW